jgi:acetyl/propionyl-CoA carboxylase alpha subunit
VLGEVGWPHVEGLRVDTWLTSGTHVTHHFDSLIAKVMAHAPTREEAVARMLAALDGTRVKGIPTNQQLLEAVLKSNEFLSGLYDTQMLLHLTMEPSFVEVLLNSRLAEPLVFTLVACAALCAEGLTSSQFCLTAAVASAFWGLHSMRWTVARSCMQTSAMPCHVCHL